MAPVQSQEKKRRIHSLTRIQESFRNERRIMNPLDFRLVLRGGKYMILLGFAHREVARNHEKSVIFRQFSLDIYIRFSPI